MGVTIRYHGGLDDPAQLDADTGDLEALLKMRHVIEEALNNPDLILRLTRWATAGDRVEPPDAEQLAGRLN
jgi:hypothetical protein